eukprot:CAMPEP_0113480888 /NCGR_PEP_ID=MMETSP0014_2-20120614/22113_1 /TAXON_ID=2857 /ORGANISM="Nitzschia sp." /LENGTH=225 /DNA_ID=CAMNT_0000374343 /DNA_START=232 /DNA_END=906 /DNA_ORIENTATION=+ /assembly_acc=CAM_ASM_000159
MKFVTIALSILSVLGLSSRDIAVVAQESTTCDDVTTSLDVSEGDFVQGNTLNFGSVTIPCPAVGGGVAYSYSFTPQTIVGNEAYASTMMSAFHDGDDPVDGIDIWSEAFFKESRDCSGSDVVNFDPPPYSATAGNSLCSTPLSSPERLCGSFPITFFDYDGEPQKITYVVYNDGGCVGNLHLEAAIQDQGLISDERFLSVGTCVTGMENACAAGAGGNGDGDGSS